MIVVIIWIGLSFLVALTGSGKKVGYWGVFFLSLLLSPLIGLIIGLVSGKTKNIRRCAFCNHVTPNVFCDACGKDVSGRTREDYQKLSNDPEYQNQLRQQEAQKKEAMKKSNRRDLKVVFIILGVLLIVLLIAIIKSIYFD